MARDPQAALVALHRFGLGARGGAAGDFGNAASDPRGFVKAELSRPNAALLDIPGLVSTPALAKAMFEYQDDVKQAREAAKAMEPRDARNARSAEGAKSRDDIRADGRDRCCVQAGFSRRGDAVWRRQARSGGKAG